MAVYRKRGTGAGAHGRRGRNRGNATTEVVISDVVHLARTRYEGANHKHIADSLAERDDIVVGGTR